MTRDELSAPPLPATVLAQALADELSAVLQLIDDLGNDELKAAAQHRMRFLPERVRQAAEGETRAARH